MFLCIAHIRELWVKVNQDFEADFPVKAGIHKGRFVLLCPYDVECILQFFVAVSLMHG